MKPKKIPYYTVKIVFKVRTKKQAKELQKELWAKYKAMCEVWVGKSLPKNWGMVDGRKF